jgi:uncharacterized membrane protein HdeD (DUF308 family)
MTNSAPDVPGSSAFISTLRGLYVIRFAVAVVWAVLLFLTAGHAGPALTLLLIVYPLVDAAAVVVQLRSEGRGNAPRPAEWINVALSVLAGIALGVTSGISTGAVLVAWGLWAALSGILQLVTAILRRHSGGQVPLIVSGAISIVAGVAFLAQGIQGAGTATQVGGYAILGGIFFLISAIRLSLLLRRPA